jgi:hypothetical protein
LKRYSHAGTELTVFLLEFSDSALEEGELGFSTISRILGSNTVTMSPSLFTVLRRLFCTRTFTRWARLRFR